LSCLSVASEAESFIFMNLGTARILSYSGSSTLTVWNLITVKSHYAARSVMLLPKPELPAMSVLLIDGSKNQRTYWADQLKRCSADYEIVEASDGESGLALYRSRRIDCVVREVALPDDSGFPTLVKLVPMASQPQVPVIVLTQIPYPGFGS
jgi:PleD family two-component response regulator